MGIDKSAAHGGFSIDDLFTIVNEATDAAKKQLDAVKARGSKNISIGEMFEMQMLMNQLSQLSEATTSVVSASHTAIQSMSRNVKG